jgi:hypothetical protein
VKFSSSFHLGVWRGAYNKPRDVPLAAGIEAGTYHAGYEDGQRNSKAIRAAARVKPAANQNRAARPQRAARAA